MKQLPTNKSIGDIAIIGMAGRFPGARDVSAFWENLKAGVESVSFFSEEELAAAGVDPQLLKNPNYVKASPTLDDIDKFDAEFFGYSPREAAVMDPQQRLFLETAWAALEDAGYDSERYDGAIGVYGGSYFDTYLLANLCTNRQRVKNLLTQSEPGIYQTYLGNDKDYLTTRVAYKMNLRGPAVTVLTACSTSLVAICQACQSLLYYQSDIALAGGVTITVPQKKGYLYQDGGMLSADGHCRVFDERAQGTIFGNGVGLVALKRLAEAVADGDHIYAVIKGSAINNDGAVKVSFTAPSVDGQAEVIALAQALAGVSADTINYIEAHGTGTPLGDPIEIAALTQAFRQSTDRRGFCGIGSLKSNVGHLDAAAGVTSVIKTALALKHHLIPPTLHFTKPNPKIDFADSPFYVVSKPTEWNANGAPRRAGVSGFGVGGTNAHVVLEEAPLVEPTTPKRPAQLLTLSAKTPNALDRATAALASHLKTHPELNLADVAYTLQVGRRAMPHRRSLVCRDATDAIVQLEKSDPKKVFTQHQERRDAPVVFMFPGQGAQFVSMGKELYQSEPLFREALDYCAEFLKPKLGLDLREALASEELLVQTRVTQPALFVMEYALAQLWMSWGIRPAAMIGHSVGEYVAGCLAGVFSLDDALTLVAERARLVQQQPRGAMLAVRLPENELRPFCNGHLSIAAVNAPALCVVSGPFDAIEEAERQFKDTGVASVRLQTSHAFHSAMMEPVVAQFAEVLRKVQLNEPQIPFVSNVTAQWITPSQATDPQYWAGHVRQPVRFADGITQLLQDPNTVLLEVGPGLTLTTLTRQHPQWKREQTVLHSLSKGEELNSVLTAAGRLWLAGATLDANAFFANESRRRVSLPTYPFERTRHWVEPEDTSATPTTTETVVMLVASSVAAKSKSRVDEIKSLLSQLSGKDYGDTGNDVTFIELGFESLFLTQVSLAIAKQFGVQVAFRQLMGDINTISLLATHLKKSATPSNTPSMPTASTPATPQSAPLTDAQRELWLAAAMGDEASCAFNQSCALHLRGELRREILENALQELAARHDGLRVTFAPAGASQNAAPNVTIPLAYSSLAGREAELDKLLAVEAAQPFDLERGPLLRARLIKLAAQHHVVLFTAHHIVCDGRSLALLLHEWSKLYSAKCCGQPCALPPARSLLAYAVEESRTANCPQFAASATYWLHQYAERPEPLELPADFSRPAQKSFRGGLVSVALPPALGRELKRAGSRRGCTLFTILLAAYYVFLRRMTGQEDIVVGVPMATLGSEGNEPLVGHTVNFLAVRRKIAAQSAWEEHLAAVKQSVIEAYEHRLFSYVSLVEKLALARETSRIPLAAVSFNLATKRQPLSFTGLEARTDANPHSYTNLDLTFDFNQDGDALHLDCVFNADLLTPETVRRWIGHFKTLLEAIAAETAATIDGLPLLSDVERQQLLVDWNDTAEAIPQKCVHDLFEEQARQTPDAVAVVFEGMQLTYRELNEQADRLAAHLRKAGVGPENIVGLHVERSLEMMVGLLGVLKAGGAYLPLDPMFPAQRLAFMQEDARPLVVLTREKIQSALRGSVKPPQAPVSRPTPENLAYVLYTSGSTGKPKGVQIAHRSVVNFLESIRREPGLTASDVVLAVTTLSFDIAALELFLPLVCGARVVIANRETAADGELLAKLIANSNATVMQATPATWRMLLAAGWQGNPQLKILCGGEALPADLAEQLLKRSREVWNMYGPTETTIWSAVQRVTPAQPIVIGRPMANTEFFVLDPQLQPVPVGVAGELVIGGDGLARGYLNRPELIAGKFIHHPFRKQATARLYRTGDRVRYLSDGTLAFLGRMDNQVKVRGFRIELGEIEAVLRAVDGVRDAVVLLREDVPGDQRLVAYLLKSDCLPKAEDLRAAAQAKLPEYMIPTAFVTLDKFPLTPNGKVDRRALPAPEKLDQRTDRTYEAPRTEVEETLAELWRTLLRVKRVGRHDNFFELGGHSLLAVKLMVCARDAFRVPVALRVLFEHPTLAQLSEQVSQLQGTKAQSSQSTIQRIPLNKPLPLSFAQERLWFFDKLRPQSALYNVPLAIRLRGAVNGGVLQLALSEIVRRHTALRTTYIVDDGIPLQVIGKTSTVELQLLDLSALPHAQREAQARRVMTEEARTPFDLTRDLALRGRLVRLAEDEHIFLLTLHHIASDGWSFDLLFRELSVLYKAFADGQPSPLRELPFQYAEFANWHRRWLAGNLEQRQLDYWKTQLEGTTGIVELPADRARPTKQSFRGATRRMELPLHLHRELTALSRAENATLHMTLLAAFITLLQRLTRQDDIVVASPVTGRDRSDTQGLIGFFVNTVLIRARFSDALEFRQLVRQVRETALSAYVNADLPFERVVALMRKELGVAAAPLGNIMFALEHPVLNSLHLKDVQATNETVTTATSKFDITFVIEEHGDKLTANLEYDTDLFDEPRIDRLLRHYQLLLEAVLKNPDERVTQLPSPPDATPRPQASSGKAEKHTHANTPTVCEMFELRAAQTPNAVAVVDGNEQWTYQELNSRANRLARHLFTRGARAGDCVGVAHERSAEMIVAWLAILKTGAAYVPLDSSYPAERIEFMLRDCGARLVVGKGGALKQIAALDVAVLDVETEREEILRLDDGSPKATIEGNSRAYVMYTSGSTGKPKGVVIPHRAILRLVVDTDYVQLTPTDVVAQASNASFDAATFEVWGALLNGARVVIVPRETLVTPAELKREIAECNITTMFVTTALFNQISRESPALFQPLRHLLFGGEAVNPSCVADIIRAGKPQRLLHVYGPTETTTFATWYEVTGRELESGAVPIGRPIANAEALVLDERRQPVPVGAVGELYIGGSGLADGYWNRPELTADKFVPHPFGTNGDRLYRTGDWVRQFPDGNLVFVGRSDNQIKLRGFRIELGEVEAVLSRHDGVQECVVTVHNDAVRGSALTAYYVACPGKRAGKSELRRHLQGILPEHMTPSFFVELTTMPMTPNGKVDRRALPAPEPTRTDAAEHIAPRNDVEQRLAAIWEKVLGVERVGVTDQFFALGGHSLLGVKLMGRIETAFGRKLPLATLFEAQTIEQLARIVSGAVEPQKWSALVELEGGRRENPFFWIHSLGGDGGGAFQYYRPLAKLLGHRGASYGIRAPEKPYDCLETMATFYVEQMQAFQPHGPYFLGGFCFGGVVAYEIARQLRKSGEEVRLVALLESSPPQRPKPTIQRLANSWYPSLREFAQLPRGQRVAFIRYKGKRLRARLRSGLARCGVVSVESVLEDAIDLSRYPRDYIQAAETHWLALSRYVPQIYDGPLLLVRQHATTDESLDYGWQALTTGAVTVVEAPGTHESILQEPNVAVVADAVARYLEKTTEKPQRIEVAA